VRLEKGSESSVGVGGDEGVGAEGLGAEFRTFPWSISCSESRGFGWDSDGIRAADTLLGAGFEASIVIESSDSRVERTPLLLITSEHQGLPAGI
jgi:hypothetical protein